MFSNKFRIFTVNRTNNFNAVNTQIFKNKICNNILNKIMSCGFKDMRKLRKGIRLSSNFFIIILNDLIKHKANLNKK